jgi:hypothetical protein
MHTCICCIACYVCMHAYMQWTAGRRHFFILVDWSILGCRPGIGNEIGINFTINSTYLGLISDGEHCVYWYFMNKSSGTNVVLCSLIPHIEDLSLHVMCICTGLHHVHYLHAVILKSRQPARSADKACQPTTHLKLPTTQLFSSSL